MAEKWSEIFSSSQEPRNTTKEVFYLMTWVNWEADTSLYHVFLPIEAVQYGEDFLSIWIPHVSFPQGTLEDNGKIQVPESVVRYIEHVP